MGDCMEIGMILSRTYKVVKKVEKASSSSFLDSRVSQERLGQGILKGEVSLYH
jgi:hypothetical protein